MDDETGPDTQWAALALAGGMAFLAGATDVYGLAMLHDLFVSFMSGNTTMLGVAISIGDFARTAETGALIALFVCGAAGGTAIAELFGRRRATAVAFAVALTLSIPVVWPRCAIPALTIAMGALNAAMNRVGSTAVGLTYVTGTLVKLGQGLILWIARKGTVGAWALHGAMWLSLLCGAVAAALAQRRLGAATLWPLAGLAFILAAATMIHRRGAAGEAGT